AVLPNPVGNILARAGRAVHRAEDRDVIAGAVAALAAVIPLEIPQLGRWRGRRRAVAAESVVAFEGVGRHVVHVDVAARGDLLAGKADNLAVLVDRGAFRDSAQSDLVTHADAPVHSQRV